MSVSLDVFVARRDGVIDWLGAPGRAATARWPARQPLEQEIRLMHDLPVPQRFELVSATVDTDDSVTQVLLPTDRVGA